MTSAPRPTRPRAATTAALVALGLALAALPGCGLASDADQAAGAAASPAAQSSAAAADWPRTVTSCGREVTIAERPERVVGIEGAAETVMALGAGDQLAGWFGTDAASLPADLAAEAGRSTYLGGSFPSPQLEDVLAGDPDLVVLYGYSQEAGLTQERLDELGVPSLVLSEACESGADATVEGYFGDVATFARALGADEAGAALVAGWREAIAAATATPLARAPRVLVNGNPEPEQPFASGGGSLADDQITLAGGTNVFGDTADGFLEPSWEEVASRDPEVVVDGSGGLEESTAALRSYLRGDAALSSVTAVREDAFLTLDYYENVPGPRVVDGLVKIADFLRR